MKVFKIITVILFSLPLLYIPLEYVKGYNDEDKSFEEIHSEEAVFGNTIWMTASFKAVEDNEIKALFSYEEMMSIKPDGWQIPTYDEAVDWLNELGFNEKPGVVDSNYYKVEWEYMGYDDPIIGESERGQKHLFWILDDGNHNYISINKDELTYQTGRTIPSSRLSVRLKR